MGPVSAAIGIASRKGNGKLRHVKVGMLRIQEKVDEEELRFKKIPGEENPADLMTKLHAAPTLEEHCRRMGLTRTSGRAEKASDVSRGINCIISK